MEEASFKPAKKKNSTILWITFAIVVAGGLITLFFLYYSDDAVTNTNNINVNNNTSQASYKNINGKVYCGDDNLCPNGFSCVSVYTVSGTEERLCFDDDILFNSSNPNVNLNRNINSNTNSDTNNNIDTNTNTSENVFVDGWETIVYQKTYHGLTVDLPANWTNYTDSMGLIENESLISSTSVATDQYMGVFISFMNNDTTFQDWMDEYENNSDYLRPDSRTTRTIAGQSAYTYINAGGDEFYSYKEMYAFIPRDNFVYIINISCDTNIFDSNEEISEKIFNTFDFIETQPITYIKEQTSTKDVAPENVSRLEVDWLDQPIGLNMIENTFDNYENYGGDRNYYQVGKITSSQYQGDDLLLILEVPWGPSFTKNIYHAVYVETDNSIIFLEKHSNNLSYFEYDVLYDSKTEIPDLSLAPEIDIPNSNVNMAEEYYNPNRLFSDYEDVQEMFIDDALGVVYYDNTSKCFLVETPDHVAKLYHLRFDFTEVVSEGEYIFDSDNVIPDISWNDGTTEETEYSSTNPYGGCGSSECHAIYSTSELNKLGEVEVTGYTSAGDEVYEFTDTDNEELKSAFDLFYVPLGEDKVDYDTFVTQHPIFFWKDPFGHWVRFQKSEYLPAVECGKPVIYLYPEEETEVNVQVDPNGGFTITEPEYPEGGWTVKAKPNGELTDAKNGLYPYLFWEGIGLNYKIPERGFVVARGEIKSFLNETLMKLGLNDKESRDFIEFWAPKMNDKPYYFITFVDQAEFDKIAPLKVTPEPDQTIRVFMDYQPLEYPISTRPLEIKTPERYGFTVVEWGGALHE